MHVISQGDIAALLLGRLNRGRLRVSSVGKRATGTLILPGKIKFITSLEMSHKKVNEHLSHDSAIHTQVFTHKNENIYPHKDLCTVFQSRSIHNRINVC